jgi:DNA repair protein RadA/Sms
MKVRSVFSCQACGFESSKWLGRCPDCGEWNSFVEERKEPTSERAPSVPGSRPKPYDLVDSTEAERLGSGMEEFDRVLGGGIVRGSMVLIGGEPGIGKSTLLLQAAHLLSRGGGKVLYVSGEESERQIKLRGERLNVSGQNLHLVGETSLERILAHIEELSPEFLVVDSVQTVYSAKFSSAPGSISQVREVATQLLFLAKGKGLTTFLIGHVTKDGTLAGPKSLEHIVDTVLYFEGEKSQNHRVVRAVKNRFGAVSELGVFEMTEAGLKAVPNPSELFLKERQEGSPGSAVVATLEGSRPMLVEVQALVSPTSFGTPRRMSLGIDPNRTTLLLAVLEKRVGLALLGDDVFVSVVGGLDIAEPAADLGVAAAVASSFRNRPLPPRTVFFGEVGLGGEVRGISQAALRIREAAQLGFTRCILPASTAAKAQDPMRLVPVKTLEEALSRLDEGD